MKSQSSLDSKRQERDEMCESSCELQRGLINAASHDLLGGRVCLTLILLHCIKN